MSNTTSRPAAGCARQQAAKSIEATCGHMGTDGGCEQRELPAAVVNVERRIRPTKLSTTTEQAGGVKGRITANHTSTDCVWRTDQL